ncbi:MAG: sensor histidine kinase [Bacteroidota bacterium]
MIKNLWSNIKSIGVNDNLTIEKKRQVVLTNQFATVSGLALISGGIVDLFIGELLLGIIVALCGPLQLITLLLNKFQKHNLASFVSMLMVNFAIFYFSSYCGFEAGVYLYYLPYMVGIAIMFELNSNRLQFLVHFSLTIFFLFVLNLTREGLFFNAMLSEYSLRMMFFNNSIASTILIAYFIFVINKSNLEFNENLQQILAQKNQAEFVLKTSLTEKETLLAEVHHRVKNNLAVVTSLLSLKMDSVSNPYTKQVLLECRNRVMSMSLIHEKLYRTKDFSNLNFRMYVDELIEEIKKSYPLEDKKITINVVSQNIFLDLPAAIPCGLLLNELVTNSYKHAFKNSDSGEINISVTQKDSEIELIVSDNGIGFNADADDSHSLGLILVESLTEQLDGKGAFIFSEGTKFILTFNIKE